MEGTSQTTTQGSYTTPFFVTTANGPSAHLGVIDQMQDFRAAGGVQVPRDGRELT